MPHSPENLSVTNASVPDAELLSDFVRHGNRPALETLLVRHTDSAYRLALRICNNSADSEEIVQTSFLNVIQNAASYRHASSVKGWIMTIVANAARNRIREESARQARQIEVMRMSATTAEVAPGDLRHVLLEVVEKLPELYRLPVYLLYLEELSYPEVAAALALPERTVRTQVSRGLEQLREMLGAKGQVLESSALASMLVTLPLEHAPTTLATSVKLLSMTATTIASQTGIAGPSAALKSTAAPVSIGWKIGVAMFLAAIGAVSLKLHTALPAPVIPPAPISSGEEQPIAGKSTPAIPPDPFAHATQELNAILDKKIYAVYRRDRLAEVLLDLRRRAGLSCAATAPQKYDARVVSPISDFWLNFESKSAAVRDVLKALCDAGDLRPECHDATIVFWKAEATDKIQDLSRRAQSSDGTIRRIAVRELGALSDPRIFSTLIEALTDENDDVCREAVYGLEAQAAVLPYVKEVKLSVPMLIKVWERFRPEQSNANNGISGIELSVLNVLAATRDDRVVDALLPVFRDVNVTRSSCAMKALSTFSDPRIAKEALALCKTADQNNRFAALYILALSKDEAAQTEYKAALATGGWIEKVTETGVCFEVRDVDRLLGTFSHGDENTWQFAFNHLNEVYDARLIDLLLKYAEGGTDQQRRGALLALGSFRDERVATRLLELLPSQSGWFRDTLIEALGKIGDARAAEPLAHLAKNCDKNLAPKLARALIGIGGKVCDDALLTLLNAPDTRDETASLLVSEPSAIEICASALQSGDKSVRLALLNAAVAPADGNWGALFPPLLNDGDPEIKDAAEKACARIYVNGTRALVFETMLQSKYPAIRIHAADLLSFAHDFSALPPIFILMKDPDANVRRAAMGALSRSGELAEARNKRLYPKGLPPEKVRFGGLDIGGAESSLVAAFDDSDSVVQNAATALFAGSYDARKAAVLRPLLKSEKTRVRVLALKSLGILAKTTELVSCASDSNPEIRAAAAEVIQPLHAATPEDAKLIQPLLKSSDPVVKLSAIRCLAQSMEESAMALVIPLLDDPDTKAMKCALDLLGRSYFEKAFRAAARFVRSKDPEVREIALKALLQNNNPAANDQALALLSDPDEKARDVVRNVIKEILAERAKKGILSVGNDRLKKALDSVPATPTNQDF